jgi:hypothetical protein
MSVREYSYEWSKAIVNELCLNGWVIKVTGLEDVFINDVYTGVRVDGRIKSPAVDGINFDVSFEVDRMIPSETRDVPNITKEYLHSMFNEHAVSTIYEFDRTSIKPLIERIAPQWLR